MTAYIALLRAANVGGTGKLPMAELVTKLNIPAAKTGTESNMNTVAAAQS